MCSSSTIIQYRLRTYHVWVESLKKALKEAERGVSAGAVTPVEQIPRPQGTPGRKGFQLQSKMGISERLYKEIRVCSPIPFRLMCFSIGLSQSQGFVKILIEKSDLDRMAAFKHQRGDEVHKIITVVRSTLPSPPFYSSRSNVALRYRLRKRTRF